MTHDIFDFDSNFGEAGMGNVWERFGFRDNGKSGEDLVIEFDLIDDTDIFEKELFNVVYGLRVKVEVDVFELLVYVGVIHDIIFSNLNKY